MTNTSFAGQEPSATTATSSWQSVLLRSRRLWLKSALCALAIGVLLPTAVLVIVLLGVPAWQSLAYTTADRMGLLGLALLTAGGYLLHCLVRKAVGQIRTPDRQSSDLLYWMGTMLTVVVIALATQALTPRLALDSTIFLLTLGWAAGVILVTGLAYLVLHRHYYRKACRQKIYTWAKAKGFPTLRAGAILETCEKAGDPEQIDMAYALLAEQLLDALDAGPEAPNQAPHVQKG